MLSLVRRFIKIPSFTACVRNKRLIVGWLALSGVRHHLFGACCATIVQPTSGERFGDVGVTHFCVEHRVVKVALWPVQLEVFLDERGAIVTSESYVLVEPHC